MSPITRQGTAAGRLSGIGNKRARTLARQNRQLRARVAAEQVLIEDLRRSEDAFRVLIQQSAGAATLQHLKLQELLRIVASIPSTHDAPLTLDRIAAPFGARMPCDNSGMATGDRATGRSIHRAAIDNPDYFLGLREKGDADIAIPAADQSIPDQGSPSVRAAARSPRLDGPASNMSTLDLLSENFQLRALMENTEDSIYFKDRACRLLRVSRRMADSLGFADAADLVGLTDLDLFGETFGRQTLAEDLRIMESNEPLVGLVENRVIGQSSMNWTLTTKVPLHDAAGNVVGLLGITREINDLKQTELDLRHQVTHDALTGLPNRTLFMERLDHALLRAPRSGLHPAVLFIDLDDFRAVNNSFGHAVGDRLLSAVGDRLIAAVRLEDTVARLGGDEFVVLIEDQTDTTSAIEVAQRILAALLKSFPRDGKDVFVGASIGLALADGYKTADELLREADTSMYSAKAHGKGRIEVCNLDAPFSQAPGPLARHANA